MNLWSDVLGFERISKEASRTSVTGRPPLARNAFPAVCASLLGRCSQPLYRVPGLYGGQSRNTRMLLDILLKNQFQNLNVGNMDFGFLTDYLSARYFVQDLDLDVCCVLLDTPLNDIPGWANCEDPNCECFPFCGPEVFCCNHSALQMQHEGTREKMELNRCAVLPQDFVSKTGGRWWVGCAHRLWSADPVNSYAFLFSLFPTQWFNRHIPSRPSFREH